MAEERKLVQIRGRASVQRVRQGTGSEHDGVVLETPGGDSWKLVRLGGNPFSDPETNALSGREVEVEGYCVGHELRYVAARDVK